jgi:hypothetical protein
VTDLGEHMCKKAGGNLPEFPNTTFIVLILQVPNSNNDRTSSMKLKTFYTVVRYWEELINYITQNCGPKEP